MAKRTSRRGFRKKSKQYSKKYSRKKSRKYTRKTYRKKNKRTKKRKNNRKIVKKNLVGGGMEDNEKHYPPASPSSPSSHLALLKNGSSAPTPGKWYGNEVNIGDFLKQKLTETGNSKLDSENLKEVRIASFTNFYRDKIYKLVNIINAYLGSLADVVVSGGDGLNNILEPKDRLVSPDVDVKVIIKHTSVNTDDWLNIYRLVVVMTEYIVDYIVCCLNGKETELIKMPLPDPFRTVYAETNTAGADDTAANDVNAADAIRRFFYTDGIGLDFLIKGEPPFDTLLNYEGKGDGNSDCIGNPWNRRTSNMKAGGEEAPFTLMNVKLIAIDLRYKGFTSYYGCLAGVLDIVIAVPGHIGHVGMLTNDMTRRGYNFLPELNINCINMPYYISEMIKMIQYGLRTRNGKLYKDLGRCYTLLNLCKIEPGQVLDLVRAAEQQINDKYPEHLLTLTEKLIASIIDVSSEQLTEEKAHAGAKEALDYIVTELIRTQVNAPEQKAYYTGQFENVTYLAGQVGIDLDANGDIDNGPLIPDNQINGNSEFVSDSCGCDDDNNRRDIEDGQGGENCDAPGCQDQGEGDDVCEGGRKRSNKRRKSNNRRSNKINKQDGGGWRDENSDTIGKVLESLNILDFFTKCGRVHLEAEVIAKLIVANKVPIKDYYNGEVPWIRVMSSNGNGNEYYIKLKEHDKILKGRGNFITDAAAAAAAAPDAAAAAAAAAPALGERLDYEQYTKDKSKPTYEKLCRERYMLYSYKNVGDNGDMRVSNRTTFKGKGKGKGKTDNFNTSRILTCENNAQIMADVLHTIISCLGKVENVGHIKYLAQFRYFPDHQLVVPAPPFLSPLPVDENQLYAMFLFSSVIRGLNREKLLAQKKKFRCNAVEKKVQGFVTLHDKLHEFYELIRLLAQQRPP